MLKLFSKKFFNQLLPYGYRRRNNNNVLIKNNLCKFYSVSTINYRYSRQDILDKFIKPMGNDLIHISTEVYDCIQSKEACIALESTIITHGMKYPTNLETALKIESIIRQNGVVPATIGIIDGKIFIGLQSEQLEFLADSTTKNQDPKLLKISRSDLPIVCQLKANGGTTVSSTSYLANLIGIRIFVTGGIGGVHRGAEITMDISSDLTELGRTPIMVVCAGIKSILDIEKTLEVLETNGVCVATFNSKSKKINDNDGNDDGNGENLWEFPAFYTPNSGLFINYNFKNTKDVAQLLKIRDQLKLNSGILLAVPNYYQNQHSDAEIEEESKHFQEQLDLALQQALLETCQKNIKGKDVTPYLLSRISFLTNNFSLKLNQNLIENNAWIGSKIALDYSKLIKQQNNESNDDNNPTKKNSNGTSFTINNLNLNLKSLPKDNNESKSSSTEPYPVVLGGSILDIVTKIHQPDIKLNGSTYQGIVSQQLGGVARNISDSIMRMGQKCQLISAVGSDDLQGQWIAKNNSKMMIPGGIRFVKELPTSTCIVTLDYNGNCLWVFGDLRIHQLIDKKFVSQFEQNLLQAPIIIIDANLPNDSIDYVCQLCTKHKIPIWFEPTDLNLVEKLFQINKENLQAIKFISPNFNELKAFYNLAFDDNHQDDDIPKDQLSREQILQISKNYGLKLLNYFPNLHSIIVTIDKYGIQYIGPEDDLDSKSILEQKSKLFNPGKSSIKLNSIHFNQDLIENVQNVSGAGDCLVGATIYGMLQKMTLKQSLQLGLKAAKHAVQSTETIPSDLADIITQSN